VGQKLCQVNTQWARRGHPLLNPLTIGGKNVPIPVSWGIEPSLVYLQRDSATVFLQKIMYPVVSAGLPDLRLSLYCCLPV
jgi:hypothetical protein